MSGATLAYNLRRNKYVERQLFMELLARYSRWRELGDYVYIGFGGLYFEEFKLLHTRFGIERMFSLEREEWMVARQKLNVPYGCIKPIYSLSSDLAIDIEQYRGRDGALSLLIWLDFVTPSETPTQLSEIRSLVPKLADGDIFKVSFSLHTRWLNGGTLNDRLANRLEKVSSKFGSKFLSEGITINDVSDERIPSLYLGMFRRAIAEGLAENPELEFCPMGCYLYSDGTPMLTITGALVGRDNMASFSSSLGLGEIEFASTQWEIHRIELPDMSLRERLEIDQRLGKTTAEQIATELNFQFEKDKEQSLDMIRNYLKLYRFYPNYHRVQL